MGGQLLTLKFGREDESEADLVGIELAARAGYDPRSGVTLWQKMAAANKNAPPQFISTHPSGPTRISDIEKNLPKVAGLYARAEKPGQRFGRRRRRRRRGPSLAEALRRACRTRAAQPDAQMLDTAGLFLHHGDVERRLDLNTSVQP